MIIMNFFKMFRSFLTQLKFVILLSGFSLFAPHVMEIGCAHSFEPSTKNDKSRTHHEIVEQALFQSILKALSFLERRSLSAQLHCEQLIFAITRVVCLTTAVYQDRLDQLIKRIPVENFGYKISLLMVPLLHEGLELPDICSLNYKRLVAITLSRFGISPMKQQAMLELYDLKYRQGWDFVNLLYAEEQEFQRLVNHQKAELEPLALVAQARREGPSVGLKIEATVLPPSSRFKRWVKKSSVQ